MSPTTLFLIESGGGQDGPNGGVCWGDGFITDACAARAPPACTPGPSSLSLLPVLTTALPTLPCAHQHTLTYIMHAFVELSRPGTAWQSPAAACSIAEMQGASVCRRRRRAVARGKSRVRPLSNGLRAVSDGVPRGRAGMPSATATATSPTPTPSSPRCCPSPTSTT